MTILKTHPDKILIGISGYAGSGKDAFARQLDSAILCRTHCPVKIKKFTEKLYTVTEVLLPAETWGLRYEEFKSVKLGPEWGGITGREFLQKLGTDAGRNVLGPDVWVNALLGGFTDNSRWIITDVRFPNEADAIRARGGIVLRINRPGVGPVNSHPSETAMDDYPHFAAVIDNDSDLAALAEMAAAIASEILKNLPK